MEFSDSSISDSNIYYMTILVYYLIDTVGCSRIRMNNYKYVITPIIKESGHKFLLIINRFKYYKSQRIKYKLNIYIYTTWYKRSKNQKFTLSSVK